MPIMFARFLSSENVECQKWWNDKKKKKKRMDINSRLSMKRKPCINIAIHARTCCSVNTWLFLMLVTGRHAKHVLIMRH